MSAAMERTAIFFAKSNTYDLQRAIITLLWSS